jgi:hypothetical protein
LGFSANSWALHTQRPFPLLGTLLLFSSSLLSASPLHRSSLCLFVLCVIHVSLATMVSSGSNIGPIKRASRTALFNIETTRTPVREADHVADAQLHPITPSIDTLKKHASTTTKTIAATTTTTTTRSATATKRRNSISDFLWHQYRTVVHTPAWLVNPYQETGYRVELSTWQCFLSTFTLHNESWNIWTSWLSVASLVYMLMQYLPQIRAEDQWVFQWSMMLVC